MKVYTSEELSKVDGTGAAAVLVAVNGKVYDVSSSKKWVRGRHMNRHQAGRDLERGHQCRATRARSVGTL